ncbi:MAG: tetratricopeptide repeat protein [Marinicaulis sp.]|nr:tetratricopeptide repeat protein [Marinicaulis sp.]
MPNSGLTLRVSTLTWPSSFAGDFRPFIETHIDAPPTAADFFAGEDSAIAAALAYVPPDGPAAQMAELFEKEKLQSGLIRFFTWLRSPIDGTHEDAADDLIAYGHDYLDKVELQKGRFMMAMARDYFPTNADARAGLGRAMELNDDPESARERYKEALELDPDHEGAKEGLARLAAQD